MKQQPSDSVKTEEITENSLKKKQGYALKVKEYTKYLIGRKLSEDLS